VGAWQQKILKISGRPDKVFTRTVDPQMRIPAARICHFYPAREIRKFLAGCLFMISSNYIAQNML
jgi:hypothetical protein